MNNVIFNGKPHSRKRSKHSLTVNKLARFLHFNNIVQFDKLICKVIY